MAWEEEDPPRGKVMLYWDISVWPPSHCPRVIELSGPLALPAVLAWDDARVPCGHDVVMTSLGRWVYAVNDICRSYPTACKVSIAAASKL